MQSEIQPCYLEQTVIGGSILRYSVMATHDTLTVAFQVRVLIPQPISRCRVTATHLFWEQGQAGSTPVISTNTNK